MKHLKRSNTYKANNVTFDPANNSAYSYGWWQFVKVIKGQVVFNRYFYSQSTSKHQSKVSSLMRELNIKIDRTVSVRESLSNITSLKQLNDVIKAQAKVDAENAELKRLERNRRAKIRRDVIKATKLAEFKANLDSITHENVLEFRANKGAI